MKITFQYICSIFIATICLLLSLQSHAEDQQGMLTPNYHFLTTSVNYLDWTEGTIDRIDNTKSDFTYIELEGGAGFNWGDAYFFIDIENPTKGYHDDAPDNTRIVAKPIFDITLFDSPWAVHIQSYYLKEETFWVNNLVVGLSYKYTADNGFWVRPFFGAHQQDSTYYSGMNGYMTGWVFGYDFTLGGYDFGVSQWNEYEFDRDKDHYKLGDGTRIGDGKSEGLNGALAFWWKINKDVTAGYQYRYANHKLGHIAYQTANIFTLKYNF